MLILGGSSEGFALARLLSRVHGVSVISSFAGRTNTLRRPAGEMRVGGFGGAAGLLRYLRREGIAAVIDATHPFAERISRNAVRAARQNKTPLLHIVRPPWRPEPGDRWIFASSMQEAARLLPAGQGKVLLTVGRSELACFAWRKDVNFIARVIEAEGVPPACRHFEILRARGPFNEAAEILLLQSRNIRCIIAKNSGGDGAYAKLAAARALGLPVIMVDRPPPPPGQQVATPEAAVRWLAARLRIPPLHLNRAGRGLRAVSQAVCELARAASAPVSMPAGKSLHVVGIGENGWDGLSLSARAALTQARTVIGSARQLALLPRDRLAGKNVQQWPSPLRPALQALVNGLKGQGGMALDSPVCVLASGDPMMFGIGASLRKYLCSDDMQIHPQISSVALACARLGWETSGCEVISLCGRPLTLLHKALFPAARLIVLSADEGTPAKIAELLVERGFGRSWLHVFGHLGGPRESCLRVRADRFPRSQAVPRLNLVAIACPQQPSPGAAVLSTVPGLPESAYRHDGQITKAPVRAITLAALSPRPGELLWDIGAGSGAVAIEWMRAAPRMRAFAFETRADRIDNIRVNAQALGVPELRVIRGRAPAVLRNMPRPDAIFIGGGVSIPGMLTTALAALKPGGRLVANGVSLEAERVLMEAADAFGGDLTQMVVSRRRPLGRFSAWQPSRPITQWAYVAPWASEEEQ